LYKYCFPASQPDDGFDERALLEDLNLVGGDERTDKEELAGSFGLDLKNGIEFEEKAVIYIGNQFIGLVFTRPSQLLDIYVDVEEQNLSLIQHAQMNEEELEELERRIRESRVRQLKIEMEINRFGITLTGSLLGVPVLIERK